MTSADRPARGLAGLSPRAAQVAVARDRRAEDPDAYIQALTYFAVDARAVVHLPDGTRVRG